jgi:hypothetical protein
VIGKATRYPMLLSPTLVYLLSLLRLSGYEIPDRASFLVIGKKIVSILA